MTCWLYRDTRALANKSFYTVTLNALWKKTKTRFYFSRDVLRIDQYLFICNTKNISAAASSSAWRTCSHIRRGRVVKTRDFKALRPWRRVKYLFLHVCDQNRRRLNTYMPRVATTRSRDGCGAGHSGWGGPRECLSVTSLLSVSHRTTDRAATAARDAISRLLSEGFLRRTRMTLYASAHAHRF